jgi:hypothetical protein
MSKTVTIAGRQCFFTRRRYGGREDGCTYSWLHVYMRGKWNSLFDPWPVLNPPRKGPEGVEATIRNAELPEFKITTSDGRAHMLRAESEAAAISYWDASGELLMVSIEQTEAAAPPAAKDQPSAVAA